ncbi:unnamed protein product [Closterium sp. NIES-54]
MRGSFYLVAITDAGEPEPIIERQLNSLHFRRWWACTHGWLVSCGMGWCPPSLLLLTPFQRQIFCSPSPHLLSPPVLSGLLEFSLFPHQLLMLLTSAIERSFLRNPKFDIRPLLGGIDRLFSALIHSFSW